MQHDNNTRPSAVPIRNGIVTLGGYGVRVCVDRGHLAVSDGVGRQRGHTRFAKAVTRIRRLVICASTGFITFEAVRWLRDAGASLVQLDYEGNAIVESVAGLDDARLRRAQAMAFHSPLRDRVTCDLLSAKIQGQIAVLNSLGVGDPGGMAKALSNLQATPTAASALRAEAKAAEAYWLAWGDLPISFARRDQVPDHWRVFGMRQSPLSLGTRKAINPANAILNFIYRLAECETRIALITRGIDPGLGFFHADTPNRRSLAADVMEPIRPHVDAHVLSLLRTRTFSAKDFFEMRDGTCRLTLGLTRELVATMPTWARLVEPYAERLARDLVAFAKGVVPTASIPSRAQQGGRLTIRTAPIAATSHPKTRATVPISEAANACKNCGAKLAIRKRVYCDACLPAELKRIQREVIPTFQAAGKAKMARLRASKTDPTRTPEAKERRAATAMQQRRANVDWTDDGSLDGVDFSRDILPGLQGASVRKIAAAMGVSLAYASKIRNGRLVPHRRHWRSLAALGGVSP